jgi:hypothetical protein
MSGAHSGRSMVPFQRRALIKSRPVSVDADS